MKFLIKILILTLAVMLTEWLLPGVIITDWVTGIWVAVLIALFNSFLRPIMIFLTLPATLITFGLFLFVINAAIILLVGHFIDGFTVNGFWWALLFSIVVTFINSLFTKDDKKNERQEQY